MQALSVRQAWAWLIVHGHKDVENRTWSTSCRGPLLIHAGMTLDPDFDRLRNALLQLVPDLPTKDDMERGGIVGRVVLTDCVAEHDSTWFSGPFGFVLEDPEPLPFLPCRGRLGFFEVDYPEP